MVQGNQGLDDGAVSPAGGPVQLGSGFWRTVIKS